MCRRGIRAYTARRLSGSTPAGKACPRAIRHTSAGGDAGQERRRKARSRAHGLRAAGAHVGAVRDWPPKILAREAEAEAVADPPPRGADVRSKPDFDVAIVGGGPAGGAMGAYLGRAGVRAGGLARDG